MSHLLGYPLVFLAGAAAGFAGFIWLMKAGGYQQTLNSAVEAGKTIGRMESVKAAREAGYNQAVADGKAAL